MSDFDIAEMLHDADKFADDNNYVEAAEIYLKITNIDNNCTSAWYGLGVSNAKLGDINKSIRSFEQAHRINPDYGPTNANLAFLLEKKDPERSVNFAKMAIESIGEDNELLRIANSMNNIEINLFDYSHKYMEGKN
jgi:tetratricopeptide (TPR) repeat protein